MFDKPPSIKAPEFPKLTWLNSKALNLDDLAGRVVLVDFWTYSCINCQRTLPYLKTWWDKYSNNGLVIIGVHTPEFEFEKNLENVKKALEKYEVSYPVALDNDYLVWNSYANHYWPAKYLIDSSGKIIYTHFGEGNYQETELQIQQALQNAGFKISDKLVGSLGEEGLSFEQTPELYFGSARAVIKDVPTGSFASQLEVDQIYKTGDWKQENEFLEHSGETKDLDDLIILKYKAKTLYLVMESTAHEPIKVYLTLDGVGLKDNGAGRDVKFDSEDRSYVEVQFSTLYNLIEKQTFGEHILRLSTTSKDLRLFAFTFGS